MENYEKTIGGSPSEFYEFVGGVPYHILDLQINIH